METTEPNENALVSAACRGDRRAFGRLVCAYQRRAYAVAYSLVGNRDDALELAQESFVRAYRAMDRFDPAMPFYPWLYRIVRNTCLNYLKKRRRRGETSLDQLMESGYDARETGRGPEEQAHLDDTKRAIHEAMATLTGDQREILRLRHFHEMSYAEIATKLGIPQGTVMSRLHGARKRLKQAMEGGRSELVNT